MDMTKMTDDTIGIAFPDPLDIHRLSDGEDDVV
jgi:hypothetical protein